MAGVSQALKRIKSDLAKLIPDKSILEACRAAGHQWRERQLGPVRTLHLFILQVMACNTAISHLRLLAGEVFSAAAFCEARKRLPLAALQTLLRDSSAAMRKAAAKAAGKADEGSEGWVKTLRQELKATMEDHASHHEMRHDDAGADQYANSDADEWERAHTFIPAALLLECDGVGLKEEIEDAVYESHVNSD